MIITLEKKHSGVRSQESEFSQEFVKICEPGNRVIAVIG